MLIAAALLTLASTQTSNPPAIHLWPNGAPGSESRKNEPETTPHPWSIANIQNPSITPYLPSAGTSNGVAVIIAPGGGHTELVFGAEGVQPSQYLSKLGYTCFALKYRLFREKGDNLTFERDTKADTERAIRYVRFHAKDFSIDPNRIVFLGFSAGGENASIAAFSSRGPLPDPKDDIDKADAKINYCAWVYPGGLGTPDTIPADAPPAFLLVANDDDHSNAVLKIVEGYHAKKLPLEVHILNGGGHGFNMGDRSNLKAVQNWPHLLSDWLDDVTLPKQKAQ